jgi:hypothetical protein
MPTKTILLMAFNENLVHNLTFFPDLTCVASGISNVTMEKADKRLNIVYGLLAPSQKKPISKYCWILIYSSLIKIAY